MTISKVYIADDFHSDLMNGLRLCKVPFEYAPSATRDDMVQSCASDCNVLLFRSKTKIDKDFLDRTAHNLRAIGRGGAGMDNIDETIAKEKNVLLFNADNANSNAVAEHVLGLIFSLTKKIYQSNYEVKQYIWKREENRGTEILGKTIGIIGFGNTGNAVGKKCAALGMKVLAYDKYKEVEEDTNILPCELSQIQSSADIISFHVPLTSETKNYFNANFANELQKKPIVINTSRGEIIDLDALIAAYKEEKIIGMGLDVLPNENLEKLTDKEKTQFETLRSLPKIILTPHVAGWSVESYQQIANVILHKTLNLLPIQPGKTFKNT